VVICLEQDADLHMAQLMPLPLIVSCFSKIQIGFAFLASAHLGSPRQRAVKQVCVCARDLALILQFNHKYSINSRLYFDMFVFYGCTVEIPSAW